MAFKEQRAWDSFKKSSEGLLKMYRIENMIGEAMPDVKGINRIGTSFWLELKAYDEWPKRETTCILKNKFEKGQLAFLCAWRSWRGHAFVLLRVGTVYYLLRPVMDLESYTRIQLMEAALVIGKKECIEYLENIQNEN